MMDGSDAIADWPILNALLNTAAGASWVSFHHGGGVGIDHPGRRGLGLGGGDRLDGARMGLHLAEIHPLDGPQGQHLA